MKQNKGGTVNKKGITKRGKATSPVPANRVSVTKGRPYKTGPSWNDYIAHEPGEKYLDLDNTLLVTTAMEGVKPHLLYEAAKLSQLDTEEIAALLNISTRTIKSYQNSGKTLSPLKGELLLKLIRLFIRGEQVFGNLTAFRRWIEKPAYGLDGVAPYAMINTSEGVNLVMDEVDRIAYGEFS